MLDHSIAEHMDVDADQPFVRLEVQGKTGSAAGRFLVDTGGGGIVLTADLARMAGIAFTGHATVEEWGMHLERVDGPDLLFSGHRLQYECPVFVILESGFPGPGNMISGHALSQYQVTFDFPVSQLVLSPRGSPRRGNPVPTPIHPATKFPRIEVTIAGEPQGMLLDTGAGCTMVSPRVLERWRREHPDWRYIEGAHGSARKGRDDLDTEAVMVAVPHVSLGPFRLDDVWMVARQMGGNYEAFSQRMMTGAAIGALGANVLKAFRVELDYASGITYLEAPLPRT